MSRLDNPINHMINMHKMGIVSCPKKAYAQKNSAFTSTYYLWVNGKKMYKEKEKPKPIYPCMMQ